MMRDRCGNCDHDELQQVLDLGTSPVANTFPTTPDAKPPRYPLGLVRCMRCDLVQISYLVPDGEIWDADYAFYSSTSPMLRAHHLDYAAWLWAQYPEQMHGGLVEIGCNDGSLLQHLASPIRATVGIDPASGPTQTARDSEWAHRYGAEIITRPFGQAAATDLVAAFGRAHVVIANNVLAHVAGLDDFIGGIRTLLHPDGVAIIEVQYLPDLLLGNDVTMVYHEHRYFYSLTTLVDAMVRRGLLVTRAWHNDMQGGTIRVEVRHRPSHPFEVALSDCRVGVAGAGVSGLQARADRVRDRLRSLLDDEAHQGRTVVGYGASAKAVTLANWLGLSTDDVRGWLDTTPAKIGRYLPGTNIPIVDETSLVARNADTYLLTVVNYLSRILRREAEWLADDHHRLIVPIPVPRIL